MGCIHGGLNESQLDTTRKERTRKRRGNKRRSEENEKTDREYYKPSFRASPGTASESNSSSKAPTLASSETQQGRKSYRGRMGEGTADWA